MKFQSISVFVLGFVIACSTHADETVEIARSNFKDTLKAFEADQSAQTLDRAFDLVCGIPEEHQLKEWPARRRSKLQLLLEVSAVADRSVDPKFDAGARPPPRAKIPDGVPNEVLFGFTPDKITDQKLRKEYDDSVATLRKQQETYLRQSYLRQIRNHSIDYIVRYIDRSFLPKELPEATKIIDSAIKDPHLKAALRKK